MKNEINTFNELKKHIHSTLIDYRLSNMCIPKKYWQEERNRKLIVSKTKASYGNIVFFHIEGTPPKGYAIWVCGYGDGLYFYNNSGERFFPKMKLELELEDIYLEKGVNL